MEPTVAATLKKFIVIKIHYLPTNYVYFKDDGSVAYQEDSVFNPLVKIEVERATSNDEYVHLRFCHNNKYWQKNANDDFIVAVSNKPEEDTSKSSCTLFEPIKIEGSDERYTSAKGDDGDNQRFYFKHVQSGLPVYQEANTLVFHVRVSTSGSPLNFVDWSTLVKLPEHVALKGDNGKGLKALTKDSRNYLQFASGDANDILSGHRVHLMPDGHVRVTSDYFGKFWRRSPNWIWADSSDTTANNKDTLFWPVKLDDNSIALTNAGNDNFCKRLTTEGKTDCLNAAVSTITNEAKMQVEELVLSRKIYDVRYRMDEARIFNESPYVAGSTSVTNNGDTTASMSVAVTYQNQTSYSFSRSLSLTAGVATSIQAGMPGIIGGASVEITYQINTTFQWDNMSTETTSVEAKGEVPVPPRSLAIVSYVGTMGTCTVPFSYMQQDASSTDGKLTETDQIDGVYTGVNCYNFAFEVLETQPF